MDTIGPNFGNEMYAVINDEGHPSRHTDLSDASPQSDELVIGQVVVAELDQSHPAGDSVAHGLNNLVRSATLGGVGDEVNRQIKFRP